MKKILLLGGSAQQIVAIETAKRLGLYTILCDYLPDNPGQYHADRFYLVSTTDRQAVLDVARKENIDYVIAYASDPAAPTAAFVAEEMGLPTNPYRAVEILCNKDMFREFLSEHGFNTPRSAGYESKESALDDIGSFRFPAIIKPVDSSGSKGVSVIRAKADAEAAIDGAFAYTRCHRIVIEEFIEKQHPYLIGGDIFVSDGKIIQWGLMNCHRDPNVNPLVPVGKSYPVLLQPAELKQVQDTLQRLVTGLGIRFGAMNVELVIDRDGKVFPVDIGPRSGGNMIPDLLGMIFDCDVVEMSVLAAMGQTIASSGDEGKPYFATHNMHAQEDGVLDEIFIDEELEPFILRKCFYASAGDEVRRFSKASDALGILFFHFPDEDTMLRMLEGINEHIQVKTTRKENKS